MTIEELREQEKQKLIQQLVTDLESEKETELTTLIRKYLEKNYHVVKRDVTAKDSHNRDVVINTILESIASNYGVTVEQIKSDSRKAPLPDVRHIYFYIARMVSDNNIPFTYLAETIKRSHCTGIHAISKISGYLKTDKILNKRVDDIIAVCRYKLRDC